MLSLTDITLTFPDGDGRITAVDRASLEVPSGTVTGLTGPSGSGKSSLLAVAATLIRPDSGSVRVGGVDATALSPAEAARLRREELGIVFQQANLLPSLTAVEQLLIMDDMASGARRSRAERRRRAESLLERMGLGSRMGLRPHQLSGGQRQRVNIARALMGSPTAVLVDEPTSALDQADSAAIIDLLVDLAHEEGTSMLLVTHELRHLDRFDAVATMVDGRLTAGAEKIAA